MADPPVTGLGVIAVIAVIVFAGLMAFIIASLALGGHWAAAATVFGIITAFTVYLTVSMRRG